MQWISEGIHDFTVADRQKSPFEELIVSWPLPLFSAYFFFFQSAVQNRGAYYTRVRIIHGVNTVQK